MYTFAHLSDPHLTSLHHISWSVLFNKRMMGYISWKRRRQAEHRREVLDILVDSLRHQKVDHIVITGDFTHLGLPEEFREVRHWLDNLNTFAEATVVPGNHEAYVATSYESTLKEWEPYFRSDASIEGESFYPSSPHFPSLRIRGPVAFIGLSTACPTLPFMATGTLDSTQIEELERILSTKTLQTYFKVLLLHHPPLPHVSRRKRLTNGSDLQAVLKDRPVDLILHGHTHKSSVEFMETSSRPIPIVGVPSASANGNRPGHESQFCLFSLEKRLNTFELTAVRYRYFKEKQQFMLKDTPSLIP